MTALVETLGLSKHYPATRALSDCNLTIESGEVFGLLGPNGSGKTTLLRLLLGFLRPTAGVATIAGLDCYRESVAVHERVAYLPGEARLFRGMRGRDVVRFFSRVRSGMPERSILAMAERLSLDLSRRVGQYSTGMRQKLALAVTMAADVPLVILDEPTANLDPTVRAEVIRLVREIRQSGRTVVFSSHVMDEVEEACDRVVFLREGRLVHEQVMGRLLAQHRIFASLKGALEAPPADIAGQLQIVATNGRVTITTPGEMSGILGWLARQPLADVRIEHVGLKALYDRLHGVVAE